MDAFETIRSRRAEAAQGLASTGGQTDRDRPAFLITIDTEGDNLWANPREITTRNAGFLTRFQALCERFRLRPTWLTNWEMVECPVYRDFARDVLARDAGEVGMHLHAWNNPPLIPLTDDDFACNPFLTQYPEAVMRDKIRVLTDRLEETFECRMLSHRAGRWGFDDRYARLLVEHGYRIDCSVTPHVCWAQGYMPGQVDYRGFPETAYRMDLRAISVTAPDSPLLELPVTILPGRHGLPARAASALLNTHRFGSRVARRLFPEVRWLRPDGRNGRQLIRTLHDALAEGRSYVEFMLHSSELMPGGSPRFRTDRSIERLYDDLEQLFEAAQQCCVGQTLTEYARRIGHPLDRADDRATEPCRRSTQARRADTTSAGGASHRLGPLEAQRPEGPARIEVTSLGPDDQWPRISRHSPVSRWP